MERIVRRNLEIKAEIVAADEFERVRGAGVCLNFGHTVGHAVEQAAGYGRFLHGEAIAVGMVAAGRLSMEFALGFRRKISAGWSLCCDVVPACPPEAAAGHPGLRR